MKFSKLSLKDAWQIEPNLFEDSRGTFRRSFCQEKYKEYGRGRILLREGNKHIKNNFTTCIILLSDYKI